MITKLPQSAHYIEGVTNIRGKIIPIVNLKRLMGLYDGGQSQEHQKVIIVTAGRITFGVLVDGITGVVNIADSDIEPSENIIQSKIDQLHGIARVEDKLIVMLDTTKLIPSEDVSIFEEDIFELNEQGDKVEVVKKIEGMGGEMFVKEVVDAREFFEKKGVNIGDPRRAVIDEVIKFMEAVASQDYKKAEETVEEIMKKGQSELFGEIGRVTRKLHNSMKELKNAIDPKFRDIAVIDMPSAVDKLQYVMEKTEEAANKTMGLVEKYIMKMDDFSDNINGLNGPPERVQYLKDYKTEFSVDLAEMLVTQSFQDITGQSIKKVIKLVGDIEEELIKLITRFGIKVERGAACENVESKKVSQEDVDDLLKELGF